MRQLKIKGHIDLEKNIVEFSLDVYLFKDKGLTYAYCPSLNIIGYGNNQKEAKDEMEYLLHEYFDFAIKKKTLPVDLVNHGWKKNNKGDFIAPSISYLMKKYPDFKDLIENREYYKYNQSKAIAEYV